MQERYNTQTKFLKDSIPFTSNFSSLFRKFHSAKFRNISKTLYCQKNIRERIFNSFAALEGQPHQDLHYCAKVLDKQTFIQHFLSEFERFFWVNASYLNIFMKN